jgi:hypothetical protein
MNKNILIQNLARLSVNKDNWVLNNLPLGLLSYNISKKVISHGNSYQTKK